MPPRSMKAVLQKKLEEKERELAEQKKSRALGASGSAPSQKVPPPSLPLKRPPSATISSQDTSASKRVKALATKASGTGGGLSRVREKEKESKGEKERGKGAASDLNVPWIPNFVTPDKKQIFKSDSLQKDPSLAFTLQSGLMLARDITAPQSLKAALNDYYFFAGRATQSIMGVQCYLTEHDNQSKLLKQKVELSKIMIEEYKKSLSQSETVRQAQEVQIANLNDLVKGLQDVAERTRDEGLAEGRALGRTEMEEEMKKLLQEQFDKGYYQAEEDAANQLVALQTEIKEAQHNKSFLFGFNMGLDEAGVQPDDE